MSADVGVPELLLQSTSRRRGLVSNGKDARGLNESDDSRTLCDPELQQHRSELYALRIQNIVHRVII
jgi:hypothetical protein